MSRLCHFCPAPWWCSPCLGRSGQPQTPSPAENTSKVEYIYKTIKTHTNAEQDMWFTYLSVQQVTLDILDQLPHGLLQTPEQLLLSIKHFISHLQEEEKKHVALMVVKCQLCFCLKTNKHLPFGQFKTLILTTPVFVFLVLIWYISVYLSN